MKLILLVVVAFALYKSVPSILRLFFGLRGMLQKPDPETQKLRAEADARQAETLRAIQLNTVPASMQQRLHASRDGTTPWIATLSPAELLIARSHGIRPIATVSATCWMQYGYSWTLGHAQGWQTALRRLQNEALEAGANAVVDVKLRTIPLDVENSMDFSLVGTAVRIDGLPSSKEPIVATVPALEFVRLLEAGIVPTGIAVGAAFQWMSDWRQQTFGLVWAGNTEVPMLSQLFERVRRSAHGQLREESQRQGNGALAHIQFSEMFEREVEKQPKQYLARYIVVATTVEVAKHDKARDGSAIDLPLDFRMVVDMHAGKTPLQGRVSPHQSYALNTEEGAI